MPITNYAGFTRMCDMCGTKVPEEIHEALRPVKVLTVPILSFQFHVLRSHYLGQRPSCQRVRY